MNQLIRNLRRLITSRDPPTLPSLVKIVLAVTHPRGGEIYELACFSFTYLFFCSIDWRVHPIPVNRFSRKIAQMHMQTDLRKCPLSKSWLDMIQLVWGIFSPITVIWTPPQRLRSTADVGKSRFKTKRSNNWRSPMQVLNRLAKCSSTSVARVTDQTLGSPLSELIRYSINSLFTASIFPSGDPHHDDVISEIYKPKREDQITRKRCTI